MLECVVNISEGRDLEAIGAIASAAGSDLLDVHVDADHHRSVLTLVGTSAIRAVAAEAVDRLDLRRHHGAHPRIGVVDVVPFVALDGSTVQDALAARDDFIDWVAADLGVPCFRYGPERTLPEVRRLAFAGLEPDAGPPLPHERAGAMAVGQRPVLVAYNAWLAHPDLDLAREIAASLRSPYVRALGLQVGDAVQVSMNLIAPLQVGPAEVVDAIARHARIERCELVGLLPDAVLQAQDRARWDELDLGPGRTIEACVRR